jgi:hypothetical protein
MSSNKDILTKEIESWGRYEYALREENRVLFHEMLNRCRKSEYVSCVNAKGDRERIIEFHCFTGIQTFN